MGLVRVLRGPSPAAEGSQDRGLLEFSTVPTRDPHHTPWGPTVPYASVGGLPFTLGQGVLPLFSYLTSSCWPTARKLGKGAKRCGIEARRGAGTCPGSHSQGRPGLSGLRSDWEMLWWALSSLCGGTVWQVGTAWHWVGGHRERQDPRAHQRFCRGAWFPALPLLAVLSGQGTPPVWASVRWTRWAPGLFRL